MAYYTLALHEFECLNPLTLSIDQQIEAIRQSVFNFRYEFYRPPDPNIDPKHEWERLFVMRFWEREIAYQTPNLFRIKLQALLKTKMPYYREIYNLEKKMLEKPFVNMDYETTSDGTKTTERTNNRITNGHEARTYEQTDNGTHSDNHSIQEEGHKASTGNDRNSDNATETNTIEHTGKGSHKTTGTEENTNSKTETKTNTINTVHSKDTAGSNSNNRSQDTTQSVNTTHNENNNNQALHSDNPQITFSQNDYASTLDRTQDIRDVDTIEKTTGHVNGADSGENSSTETDVSDVKEDGSNTVAGGGHSSSSETTNDTDSFNDNHTINKNGGYVKDYTENVYDTTSQSHDASGKNSNHETGQDNLDSDKNENEKEDIGQTSTGLSKTTGWNGSKAETYQRYIEALQNINERLLNDCEQLFMGVLANPWGLVEDISLCGVIWDVKGG